MNEHDSNMEMRKESHCMHVIAAGALFSVAKEQEILR